MKTGANFQFSRRSLMKAAGSTLLVPTFLKQAFAQTVATTPNLVLLMQTNGTHQASFWPAAGGTYTANAATASPILDPILSDPAVGPKTTLINGIFLNKAGSPGGDGHDWGWHGIYSGMDNIAGGGGQFGGGPSVDQILLNNKSLSFKAPFPSLHTAVNAANYQLINAGRASWVCASAGLQVPVQIDIYALYTQVLGPIPAAPTAPPAPASTAATAAATQRLAQRKSVLDTVAADLTALEGRLGTAERAKVDIHLQAVRDFETPLSSNIATGTTSRLASCASVQPSMMGVPSTGQGNEANAPELFILFMEFIANCIGCNMVNILTFQAGRGGEHFHYAWLNLPGMAADFHNGIAHTDTTNVSTSGTSGGVMVGVAQYQAKMVLSLAQKLAMFPQANGMTALDNSLVVYGNELATGPHGTNGYPIVFFR